jgi:transposase
MSFVDVHDIRAHVRAQRRPASPSRGAIRESHPPSPGTASAKRSPQLTLPASWSRSRRPARSRRELAGLFLEDLRGLDAQLRDTRKKLAAAVRASGTSLTGVFGFGPASTGTVIGDVTDVTRLPSRDHFASCNGTAPVEVSSGNRKIAEGKPHEESAPLPQTADQRRRIRPPPGRRPAGHRHGSREGPRRAAGERL